MTETSDYCEGVSHKIVVRFDASWLTYFLTAQYESSFERLPAH